MEAIVFTDAELSEAKKRILFQAEERMINELLTQWRQEVTREARRDLLKSVSNKLEEEVRSSLTKEKIQGIISDALKTKSNRYYDGSWIEHRLQEEINKAVSEVATGLVNQTKDILINALMKNE